MCPKGVENGKHNLRVLYCSPQRFRKQRHASSASALTHFLDPFVFTFDVAKAYYIQQLADVAYTLSRSLLDHLPNNFTQDPQTIINSREVRQTGKRATRAIVNAGHQANWTGQFISYTHRQRRLKIRWQWQCDINIVDVLMTLQPVRFKVRMCRNYF